MRNKLLSLISAIALVATAYVPMFAPVAQAATSESHAAKFNNQTALAISITKGFNPSGVNLGSNVSPAAVATSADAVNLDVDSNANWQIQVKAETANFTSGANNIPIGRLGWKLNGGGSFTTMTTTDAQVTTGAKPGSATDVSIDYQLTLLYSDPVADNYTANIVYTVAAN